MSRLKETQIGDASWPEDVDNVQVFPSAAFFFVGGGEGGVALAILCSKIWMHFCCCCCCFIIGINDCMALYFNTKMPNPMLHLTSHSSLPTTLSKFSPAFHVPICLNPIKHIWDKLDRCVQGRVSAPANVPELFQTLQQELVAVPVQVTHILMQSMSKRCWTVVNSREHLLLICMSFSHKIPTDWTVSWMRRVLKSSTFTWINCKMKFDEL